MTERELEAFLFKHTYIRKTLVLVSKLIEFFRSLRHLIRYLKKPSVVRHRATRFSNYQNNKLAYFLGFWPDHFHRIYEVSRIEFLYRENPALFRNAWRRATNRKVRKRAEFSYETSLWITLNIIEVVRATWRKCYYCWRPYTLEEFLDGQIEVEHMNPLSGTGTHTAPNIVTACSSCNRLKGNLTDTDIIDIFRNPDKFFAKTSYKPDKKTQLIAFARMTAYGLVSDEEFYPAEAANPRQHTPYIIKIKSEYRQRWR